ncbi:helix-turn-helix transcriptional regulator [Bdellovibrionota bacterium FG-1]
MTKDRTHNSDYSFPKRLKFLRDSREYSQAVLAKKVGLTQSAIAQIENGTKDPSIATVKRLADALDVDVATLFASEDVHVFDFKRLKARYRKVDDLTPVLHMAIGKVIRYAKKIGYLD